MKILGFSTSNKKESINKSLVQYIGNSFSKEHSFELLDMTQYDLPIYSEDKEQEIGIPQDARYFFEKLGEADVLVIGLAEHNGSYTAFYKNLFDWSSRIDMKVYQDKKVVVISTSPGPGGAGSVLNQFNQSSGFFGANIISSISLASFYDNFKDDIVLNEDFNKAISEINL